MGCKGKSISKMARQVLRKGAVRGRKLTSKQYRWFGMLAGMERNKRKS